MRSTFNRRCRSSSRALPAATASWSMRRARADRRRGSARPAMAGDRQAPCQTMANGPWHLAAVDRFAADTGNGRQLPAMPRPICSTRRGGSMKRWPSWIALGAGRLRPRARQRVFGAQFSRLDQLSARPDRRGARQPCSKRWSSTRGRDRRGSPCPKSPISEADDANRRDRLEQAFAAGASHRGEAAKLAHATGRMRHQLGDYRGAFAAFRPAPSCSAADPATRPGHSPTWPSIRPRSRPS